MIFKTLKKTQFSKKYDLSFYSIAKDCSNKWSLQTSNWHHMLSERSRSYTYFNNKQDLWFLVSGYITNPSLQMVYLGTNNELRGFDIDENGFQPIFMHIR